MQNKTESILMTLGESVIIHGVTVKKMTFGKYLASINYENELSVRLEAITSHLTDDYIENAAALADLIDELTIYCAKLFDIEKDTLGELSLPELIDLIGEFNRINDLTEFFKSREDKSSGDKPDSENWVQQWLAVGLSIGLDKDEMLNRYHLDELITMIDEYNAMHSGDTTVDAENF